MPVVKSNYIAPLIFRNYHLSTMYASIFRKIAGVEQVRDRLELEDGDFIDLDWSHSKERAGNVLIILHGLEGNSQRPYVLGLAKQFTRNGWDVAAVNFRGCSGEINRLYRSYNAGASEDLIQVVSYVLGKEKYKNLALTGFSLGGNLVLKYLGEGNYLPQQLKAAVAISTPCDLYKSLQKLQEPGNRIYSWRFVKKLKKQLLIRERLYPHELTKEEILACKSLYAIDELYTGKAHGFNNARDYYNRSSSLAFIQGIKVPTLLINAQNDQFLSENSSPVSLAQNNDNFHLEMPKHGGHVGFLQRNEQTYTEERALEFITEQVNKCER